MRTYLTLAVVYLVPRLLFLAFSGDVCLETIYWKASTSVIENGSISYNTDRQSTDIEVVYVLVLAFCRLLTGSDYFLTMALQAAFSAIGCIYLYKMALLLTGSNRTALLASLIFALYPYLIRQSVAAIEVPIHMTFLIISVYLFCRAEDSKGYALCGLLFGLTAMSRATSLPVLLLALLVMLLRKQLRHAAVFACCALIIMAPFLARNYAIDGSLFPTRDGLSLYLGNNELYDKLMPRYSVELAIPSAMEMLSKEDPAAAATTAGRNRYFNGKAYEYMAQNPLHTLKVKLLNVLYLFYPRVVPLIPHTDRSRLKVEGGDMIVLNSPPRPLLVELSYSIPYIVIFFTALAGMWGRRSLFGQDIIFYCIIISFAAVFSFYWPCTRFRAPMEFIFIFYSSVGLSSLIGRIVK